MTSRVSWLKPVEQLVVPLPVGPQQEFAGTVTDAAAALALTEQRRKEAKRAKVTSKEDLFDFHLRSRKLPKFVRQYPFARSIGRKWLLDFACEQYMLAVEVEGLVVQKLAGELVVRGRHASISGFKEDCVKYASAAMLGWTVLRFEQSQVKDETAIDYTMRVLAAKGWRASQ